MKNQTTNYGPVSCTISHNKKQIRLSLKRAKNPLGDGTIAKLRDWARSVAEADNPDYEIIDKVRCGQ